MTKTLDIAPANDRELVLARWIDAPPAAVWRAWTEPALVEQWFCPRPWRVTDLKQDIRPGGASFMIMRGPDGEEMPIYGVFLEVVPGRRIIFTDAFTSAWVPAEKAFMTASVEMEPEAGGTRYIARAGHWNVADREKHEQMGFHQGWGIATEQLEQVARGLGVAA